MLETLNAQSKIRGWECWEDFAKTLQPGMRYFIQDSIMTALKEVNWQSLLHGRYNP